MLLNVVYLQHNVNIFLLPDKVKDKIKSGKLACTRVT